MRITPSFFKDSSAKDSSAKDSATKKSGPQVKDAEGVRRLYDRLAPIYDLAAKPFWALGADGLISKAIDELHLEPGSTVVDLGTGTGRNLPVLSKAVGPKGRVIGIDLSANMLLRAQRRLSRLNISNVTLLNEDMATYEPPHETSAVLATYSIEMLPNSNAVLNNLNAVLPEGARIAITGLRTPSRWPKGVIRLASLPLRPFGVNESYRPHQPWLAVANLQDPTYQEAFFGAMYMAAGSTKPASILTSMP